MVQPNPPTPTRTAPRPARELTASGPLLRALAEYLDAAAVDNIRAACQFSARAHAGQSRASGEEYIHHPLAVARDLAAMRMDSCTIIAAVLHDVAEDTDITIAQIAAEFGDEVAALVDGVSKVSQLEQSSAEQLEGASFRKMFIATAKDIRVIIVKLADRLHNMRTLDALGAPKRRRIAKQTLEIYAPIANRLGMRDLAQTLEDLGLRNLYPKRYAAIAKKLRGAHRGRKSVVKELIGAVQHTLQRAGVDAEVQGREKDIYSIYCKMREKNLHLKDLRDIHAIRVIVATRARCYQALGLLHQLYKPRPESFKDYIAIPKVNGYQSLHTILVGPFGQPVEAQIRSREMHAVAEQGVAAHWLYKNSFPMATAGEHSPHKLAQQWLRGLLESPHSGGDAGEFLEHLKADLFPDEIYVFTPKGDLKRLPRNASAVDFSYAVHTDVGHRSIGARINGQIAPLHQALRNGDHIEILTRRGARPHPVWLEFAVTSKARAAIRHFLSQQRDHESVKLGRKLLRQALHRQGYRRLRIPTAHKIALLQRLHLPDWRRLLRDIGFGNRPAALAAKQLLGAVATTVRPPHDSPPAALTIEGAERLVVTYAHCCYPIRGDNIIGVMTRGRGLTVHRAGCTNCRALLRQPDNYFHLAWAAAGGGVFAARIKLETRNEPGALAAVSRVIARHRANINHLQVAQPHHHTSAMEFIVEVTDRVHLAAILRELHNAPMVLNLARG